MRHVVFVALLLPLFAVAQDCTCESELSTLYSTLQWTHAGLALLIIAFLYAHAKHSQRDRLHWAHLRQGMRMLIQHAQRAEHRWRTEDAGDNMGVMRIE